MTLNRKLKESTLLQLYTRAAAPSRDYYGLTIGEAHICVHAWKISHGPHVSPKQKKCSVEDMKDDKFLQEEIKNVFGVSVFGYIMDLANKRRKLENLPTKLFLNVLKYLAVNDILNLLQTSKIFLELCNTNPVWHLIFNKRMGRGPSAEEKRMAFDYTWREYLQRRITYIRKAAESKQQKKMQFTATPNSNPNLLIPYKNRLKTK